MFVYILLVGCRHWSLIGQQNMFYHLHGRVNAINGIRNYSKMLILFLTLSPPLQDNAAYIPVQPIEVQETYQIIISVWARIISKIISFIVKLLENILRIKILWFLFILKSSLKKERKQSDSWENCEFPFFLVKAFLLYWLCRKKFSVFSSRRPKKHLHTRSSLLVPHSQPASPKWRPTPEITWHHDQSPWEWFIKPSRVISTKTTQLVCVLLPGMQWRLTCVVVGVVVVVGATTALKAIPRERVNVEDCSFQGTLETAVRLC